LDNDTGDERNTHRRLAPDGIVSKLIDSQFPVRPIQGGACSEVIQVAMHSAVMSTMAEAQQCALIVLHNFYFV
jgi:hypothetical protein